MSSHDKRRKVRKGTHSCWQCRRRKIRCEFKSEGDKVCDGCRLRGLSCVSQEYGEEQAAGPPDRRLAQRLGRLEELMVRLADKIGPDSLVTENWDSSPSESRDSRDSSHHIDVLETSVAENAPILSLLGVTRNRTASMPTPGSDDSAVQAPPAKYERIRKTLHALFPSPQDLEIIAESSPGPAFILVLFYSRRQIAEGQCPSVSSFAEVPDISSHPAILAKRLLQLIICMQQLPPTFDASQLHLKKSIKDTMVEYATTVSTLVTSGDDLVGSIEGLECLILQGFYQANCGNLRKSWLAFRRALSLAQLMGLEGKAGNTRVLPSCDTKSENGSKLSPQVLWFKVNFCDRYQSLMLGLPVGTLDNSFASEEMLVDNTPTEKLEKLYTVIAARVIERNAASPAEAYTLTQSIDCELEMAAKTMGSAWWTVPNLAGAASIQERMDLMTRMMLQIYHHSLLLLLHLPYMLRAPTEYRFEYSKNTCLQSSREVIRRCIDFRMVNNAAFCCRHVDYCALVGVMTLLLGNFWGQSGPVDEARQRQRNDDRALVEMAKNMMDEIRMLNHDSLSKEAAEIIKQMLPIMDKARGVLPVDEDDLAKLLQFHVPYFGTVNINPSSHANSRAVEAARNSQMPTPSSTARSNSVAYSGAFDSLSNPSLFLSLDSHPEAFGESALLTPDNEMDILDSAQPDFQEFSATLPGITADACDWAFQGVDTTYWSLVNSGMNSSGR